MKPEVNQEKYDRVVALFEYGEEVYTLDDTNNNQDIEEAFVVGIVTGDTPYSSEKVVWPLLAIKHSVATILPGNSLSCYDDHLTKEKLEAIHLDYPSTDYTFWAFDSIFIHKKEIVTLRQILKQLEHETLR